LREQCGENTTSQLSVAALHNRSIFAVIAQKWLANSTP